MTPQSTIEAIPGKGMFMGNRGCLHRDHEIVLSFSGKRWIICDTEFRGRAVEQWAKGLYTPLFFHDEAVALAAGHRPCAECRHGRYNAYRDAWTEAFGTRPSASEMDARLHDDRLHDGVQRTSETEWSSLPDGAFAMSKGAPVLVLGDAIVPWADGKYGTSSARPTSGRATVLTPAASLRVLSAGYTPTIAPIPSSR